MTTPNTNIKILKGVPFNNKYENVVNFANETLQYTYFNSKKKYEFTLQSYVRIFNGVIRIEKNTDDLYDCNYLMLQNATYGTKWFYAFITKTEYVNDNVCNVFYEIDVVQSWWFDLTIRECFVEREHVVDDTIGVNTLPENLEIGEYVTTSQTQLLVEDLDIYVLATENVEDIISPPRYIMNDPDIIGGFPTPLYWTYFNGITEQSMLKMKALIDRYADGKSDSIVSIFTAPSNFISRTEGVKEQLLSVAPPFTTAPVKNNKLYTYPYTCCAVIAGGQGLILKYELFDSTDVQTLKIRGGFGANLKVSATPQNYRSVVNDIENTLTISGFPLIPYVRDYYQNWVAQNHASMATNLIGSTIAIGVGGVTGNLPAMGAGLYGLMNFASKSIDASVIPDSMVGNAEAVELNSITKLAGFYTMCKTIRPEYVEIIDDIFNKVGYKVSRVKVPNISSRPHWNYVKTNDANILGSIPVNDLAKIRDIFNNGVTFWRNPDSIGNYSLDNRPT